MASGLMYVGVGANTGKTVFTRAHCRLLSDRGLRVSPFKPVTVTERRETRGVLTADFRLWIAGAAARCRITQHNGPVEVLRTGPTAGAVRIYGVPAGDAPLLAKDTPLFPASSIERVLAAIGTAHAELAARSDVVVIEGAGSCADLVDIPDPANTYTATVAEPAVVLIAGAQAGGAVAALRGTWSMLPERMRDLVIGFALNDVSAGHAILEKGAARVAADAGVAFLGVLPHAPSWDGEVPGQVLAHGDTEEECVRLAEHFRAHLDVGTIEKGAGLD